MAKLVVTTTFLVLVIAFGLLQLTGAAPSASDQAHGQDTLEYKPFDAIRMDNDKPTPNSASRVPCLGSCTANSQCVNPCKYCIDALPGEIGNRACIPLGRRRQWTEQKN